MLPNNDWPDNWTVNFTDPQAPTPFGASIPDTQSIINNTEALASATRIFDEPMALIRTAGHIDIDEYLQSSERHGGAQRGLGDILGSSRALSVVLDQIQTVAPTDATVLIEGETGTGKELIANAIHAHSRRSSRPFVKLNCAAIPAGLIESELFGHEKGAFTGAVMQKPGRFEAADGGTLFLDEIGDIPLELQSKLLRVLQEKEFERLGSTSTRHVNVRVVAATNQDLAGLVEEKRFRMDLYYRLNVFPIDLPPLRHRPDDIPMLVAHFVKRYAMKMGKRIDKIAPDAMERLLRYPWPGNIRELQNFIERAVILTDGDVLCLSPLPSPAVLPTESIALAAPGTLDDAQRSHILQTLQQTKGMVGGREGAAARLGLPRTTLLSKMKRLGVSGFQGSSALARAKGVAGVS
ncbi:MAG: fhlA [Candidatus Solibacter sp.]|nr:fhlA [Candidatus Solibacter sp.]